MCLRWHCKEIIRQVNKNLSTKICHSIFCMCVFSRSVMSNSSRPQPKQAFLSMEFFRQEYWSKLLFPTPRYLPNLGIEPAPVTTPALAGGFFTSAPPIAKTRNNLNIHHQKDDKLTYGYQILWNPKTINNYEVTYYLIK